MNKKPTFASVIALWNELSNEEQLALVNSDNRPAIKKFLAYPTEMTVGGITYDILGFLQEDEDSVTGDTMVARAKKKNAHIGKEDRENILAHQGDIPVSLRGKVIFVFTDDRSPDYPELVYCVHWDDGGGCWFGRWRRFSDISWHSYGRVLRRKSAR